MAEGGIMLVQKIKRVIIGGICIILAILYILQRPTPINKELEAVVYTVNQEEYETSIVIDGSIKKELFTEEASFAGYFKIESYPKSYYAGTTAKIDWHSDVAQNIRFMCAGTISSLDIDRVEIDRTMDNIKIILRDGTIISTKKKMLRVNSEHLFLNDNRYVQNQCQRASFISASVLNIIVFDGIDKKN